MRSAPPTERAALSSAIGAVEFGEIEDQDARRGPLADAPQRGIERRLEGQLVVELQLADDPLDAVEGRLILEDGDDALAIRLLSARRRRAAVVAAAALMVHSRRYRLRWRRLPLAATVAAAMLVSPAAAGNCTLSVW